MWRTTAFYFCIFVIIACQSANVKLAFNCAAGVKPGMCILNSIKASEHDTFGTLSTPSTARSVTFENSQLDILQEVFFNTFPQLENLHASNIKLKKLLPATFYKAPMLQYLDVSRNLLKTLPDNVFGSCQHLEVINISDNKLSVFNGAELIGCLKMQRLNVSFNQLVYFNWDPLNDLKHLNEIDISSNLLTKLMVPKNLKKLIARNNHIHEFTTEQNVFIFKLEYLDASRNRLSNVATLARFSLPTYIDLSYNRLLSLDFALFKNMRSLRVLRLAHNNIFTVTTSDLKPIALELVDLSYNELTHLSARDSAGIGSAENLLINNNFLVSLEVANGVANFPRLTAISLDNNDWICADLEAILSRLKLKKISLSSGAKNCHPYQIIKSGICCRDLGTSFDELVLLKSEKLEEIRRASVSEATPVASIAPPTTLKSVTKVLAHAPVLSSPPPKYVETEQLGQSLREALARLSVAEAQIEMMTNQKTVLEASLLKAQNNAHSLDEELKRCKASVNQRTGQKVLIH